MQRKFYFKNKKYRVIRGYFYLASGKRVQRFMCTFEQAGLDDFGEPIDKSARAERQRAALLERLHRTQEKELLDGEKRKAPAATPIKTMMDSWVELSKGSKKPATIKLYEVTRAQYLDLVGDHPIFDVDEASGLRRYPLRHVDKFQIGLKARGIATATIAQRLRTLKTFLRWVEAREEIDRVPRIALPQKEKKIAKSLDDSQVGALFALIEKHQREAKTEANAWYCHLHERFLMVALGTGRRLGEIHSRKWADFELENGRLFVGYDRESGFDVKNREESWVNLPATLLEYLRDLRAEHSREVWFFDNGAGGLAFKRYALTRAFGRYIHNGPNDKPVGLGIKEVKSTHNFRAGYITQMFRDGIDLETIRRSAGHSALSVTVGYLSEPDAKMKEAVEKYDRRMSRLVSRRRLQVFEGGKKS